MGDSAIDQVNGWLISPDSNWCYQFHSDQRSLGSWPFVFIDKWSTQSDGRPMALKTRVKVPLDEALELCGSLLLTGWKKLTYQY
tara:strand:- start:84 stop:335 length:252 start_codon:yes stop_codon:yes gene_type:complete